MISSKLRALLLVTGYIGLSVRPTSSVDFMLKFRLVGWLAPSVI